MLPKIKLPEIQLTPYSMLKDLSEENSPILLYKKIVNNGLSKLKLEPIKNQLFVLNLKEK